MSNSNLSMYGKPLCPAAVVDNTTISLIAIFALEIFGIVSLGSYQINPSKLDTVTKFGKILNVKNESNYLVLELEMRDKLVDRLLNLKIMEKNINA